MFGVVTAVDSTLFMRLFTSSKEENLPLYPWCDVTGCAGAGSSLLTSRLGKLQCVGFPAKLSSPSLSFYFLFHPP